MHPAHDSTTNGVTPSIGDRIRAARKAHGWSVPELAHRVHPDCSVDTIKRFEKIGRLDGYPNQPPKHSRYFPRALMLLGIRLDGFEADDPDDPRCSQATKAQLVTWLARLIYAEGPLGDLGDAPFVIRGVPLGDDERHAPGSS